MASVQNRSISLNFTHVVRIAESALQNIPQKRFVPQHIKSKTKVERVKNAFPAVFAKLLQGRWLVLRTTPPPPSFNVALGQVELLGHHHQLKMTEKSQNDLVSQRNVTNRIGLQLFAFPISSFQWLVRLRRDASVRLNPKRFSQGMEIESEKSY